MANESDQARIDREQEEQRPEKPAVEQTTSIPEFDATGLEVTVYDDIKFEGQSKTIACCGSFPLTFGVSSAKISPGVQAIFSAADDCAEFGDVSSLTSSTETSDFTDPQIGFNDRAKCVRLISDHFYRPSPPLAEGEEPYQFEDTITVKIAEDTVKIFADRRYGGEVQEFKCCGTFNLVPELASSVQIAYGLTVSLHTHEGCPDGSKLLLRNHSPDLAARGFNDLAVCAKVERDDLTRGVTLYNDRDFEGERQFFKAGTYLASDLQWNDRAVSVKIPPKFEVTLYEHNLLQGEKVTLNSDTYSLASLNFDLKTSSLVVSTVCEPACVNGMCVDPDECECTTGWSGDTCDKQVSHSSDTVREEL